MQINCTHTLIIYFFLLGVLLDHIFSQKSTLFNITKMSKPCKNLILGMPNGAFFHYNFSITDNISLWWSPYTPLGACVRGGGGGGVVTFASSPNLVLVVFVSFAISTTLKGSTLCFWRLHMKWLSSFLRIVTVFSKLFTWSCTSLFDNTLLNNSPTPLDFIFNPVVIHVSFVKEFALDLDSGDLPFKLWVFVVPLWATLYCGWPTISIFFEPWLIASTSLVKHISKDNWLKNEHMYYVTNHMSK